MKKYGLSFFLLVLLTASCTDHKLLATMPGDLILQASLYTRGNGAVIAIKRIYSEAPGKLAIEECRDPVLMKIDGPILMMSPDSRYLVYVSSIPITGSEHKEFLNILNRRTGSVDSLELLDRWQSEIDISISPDSRWIAYADCGQVCIYDCATKKRKIVRSQLTATYNGNYTIHAYAGDVFWHGNDALYYEYRSSMPNSFGNTNNPAVSPDRYEIIDTTGRVIENKEIAYPRKTNSPLETVQAKINDPGGLGEVVFFDDNYALYSLKKDEHLFFIDLNSGEKIRLGTTNNYPRYYSRSFWNTDKSWLFLLVDPYQGEEQWTSIFAIPISAQRSLSIDVRQSRRLFCFYRDP